MANIKQQRKRVKIARRERLENLRYKSRIKTLFKSLAVAAREDEGKAQQLGLELISLIDRAAGRGVLHTNSAARKKSRVAAIVEPADGVRKPVGPAAGKPKGKSKAELRSGRAEARQAKKSRTRGQQADTKAGQAKAEKTAPKEAKAAASPAEKEKPAPEAASAGKAASDEAEVQPEPGKKQGAKAAAEEKEQEKQAKDNKDNAAGENKDNGEKPDTKKAAPRKKPQQKGE